MVLEAGSYLSNGLGLSGNCLLVVPVCLNSHGFWFMSVSGWCVLLGLLQVPFLRGLPRVHNLSSSFILFVSQVLS